jgi:hypothetical protein
MEAAVVAVDFDLTANLGLEVVVHFLKAAGFVGHLGPDCALCRAANMCFGVGEATCIRADIDTDRALLHPGFLIPITCSRNWRDRWSTTVKREHDPPLAWAHLKQRCHHV